ncbi:MAG: hypothetical protein QOC63_2540 [Mycobacterium sp.]|jgi:hypothetical protein|nr:hypothetical protein [Mycobacterium sp.]
MSRAILAAVCGALIAIDGVGVAHADMAEQVRQAMDAQTARDPAERAVEILQTEGMSKSDATLAAIDAVHNHAPATSPTCLAGGSATE